MENYQTPQVVKYGAVANVVRAVSKGKDILEGNFMKIKVDLEPLPLPFPEEVEPWSF